MDVVPPDGHYTLRHENRVATWILAAIVAAAPLPYGLTDLSSLSGFVAAIGLALVTCTPKLELREDWLLLGAASSILAIYSVVLAQNLSSNFLFGLRPDDVWGRVAVLLGDDSASMSVVKGQPFFALGNVLACSGAATCAFFVARDKRNADQLIRTVAWSGLFYAVYGIWSYLYDPTAVLWRQKVFYRTVLNGTFPNRNTAAIYFGVCAIVWLLLIIRRAQGLRSQVRGHGLLGGLQRDLRLAIRCLAFSVCLLAAMLTGSRAGVGISLLGITGAAILTLRQAFGTWRFRWQVPALLVVGVCCSFLVFGGQVSERINEHGVTGGGRWQAYSSTMKMISDHPIFGTGLGTFPSIFPRYRSGNVSIWGIWDRAHSTPLELAAEGGIPLLAVVSAAWVVGLTLLFRGSLRRRQGAIYPIAGLVCGSVALVHSAVDFSLQVPGFAVVVMVLLGLGLAQRRPEQQSARRGSSRQG
jgi:hypothetical protein